ncbi:class I SAM-dependent methyltransferase [Nakamurella antarctica]|uniref:Class I SAM-dependent methyltransferase n=1 Tax=Nakamurella antarctica TaxID=1902245 RepID=A0A3G8ZN95_9ACTN|nr:class I SAM-dependent methyltransferase [Nakamurella antarctica]AZI58608.1 class I SAM-dependent methyltransferase [Nakamurella antarctica]
MTNDGMTDGPTGAGQPAGEQNLSRQYWDGAAREDALWFIATGAATDKETFYASGRKETDEYLAFADIAPDPNATVLEIGCGAGRMTARLAQLYGRVIALDVSQEMLDRAAVAMADLDNVTYVLGNGSDLAGVDDSSVDVVFSYIVLQHVPTVEGQLSYFRETRRVLKPGGKAAIQVRSNTVKARALEWAGHARHRVSGRKVLSKAWRGAHVPVVSLMAAASGSAVSESGPKATVTLKTWGPRHTWVMMRRQA